jgi:16S rRNA (adenine1518-N6/adenine1519-N6)-dimethyltransferase
MPEKSMRPEGPRGRTRRQALGRHYLASPGILTRILDAIAPAAADLIIEIGPGRGALTYPLAERAGRVAAIETDEAAVRELERSPRPNLEIVHADILDVDLPRFAAERRGSARTVKLVGNLPYSISSPLLFKVLGEREAIDRAAFLLQKEVAERVCASPGGREYGPLSVRLQAQFEARVEFLVRPGSFVPPPKVDSAFIALEKRTKGWVGPSAELAFGRFLAAAFRRRRRTLWNNLAAAYPASLIGMAFDEGGLGRAVRAEDLPVKTLIRLFIGLKGKSKNGS